MDQLSLTRLSVHESVDDLCKKVADLWAGSEKLGIVAAARTRLAPVTWENIICTLCIKEKRMLSTRRAAMTAK